VIRAIPSKIVGNLRDQDLPGEIKSASDGRQGNYYLSFNPENYMVKYFSNRPRAHAPGEVYCSVDPSENNGVRISFIENLYYKQLMATSRSKALLYELTDHLQRAAQVAYGIGVDITFTPFNPTEFNARNSVSLFRAPEVKAEIKPVVAAQSSVNEEVVGPNPMEFDARNSVSLFRAPEVKAEIRPVVEDQSSVNGEVVGPEEVAIGPEI
jgi:hypothetical protein